MVSSTGTRNLPAFPVLDTGVRQAAAEERVLEFWRAEHIFKRTVDERSDERHFVFYEGPPTTNGRPGVHHVLARTVKDLVCRFWTMEGYKVRRKGGWDTHGLPVEIEVEKELGIEGKQQIEAFGLAEFNARCRKSVFKYKDEWDQITERIGFWLDLEHPYVTLENDYIETVWWILKRFWDEGLFYAGFKVLPYCPRCQTSLSDHEVSQGYKTVKDPSVTVKFALEDEPGAFILAWTTTPWTLPGNVALAVGKQITYLKVRQGEEVYYLAQDRVEVLRGDYEILGEISGADLVGRRYRPLFSSKVPLIAARAKRGLDIGALTGKKAYYVAPAAFVTTEDGTGVVHTAVMYGADDYTLGQEIDLPKFHTVDETGHFTDQVPLFAGERVREIDPKIVEFLRESGQLYRTDNHEHSYPFCWRCDTALLYYARDSWYLRTTALKEKMLAENERVRWLPPQVGKNRFGNWLENNVDWAISRDRYWGTPMPLWRCDDPDCGKVVCIGGRDDIAARGGTIPEDLHRPQADQVVLVCESCKGPMHRVNEVVDVWFDSGSMPFAQWHYPFENKDVFESMYPADFICEGIDQSRGWFYSLLVIGTLVKGQSPYRTAVANELILDEIGRKMSKRLGNAADPWEVLGEEGADALRWYLVTNSPPWVTTRFSREGVTEVARKFFGTLRNVAAFFASYANVDGWTPGAAPPLAERPLIDRWLLSRLDAVSASMRDDLRNYQMTRAGRTLSAFVQDELSNWYVRRNRRRFWKGERGPDKDAAYATLHEALATVARLMAPFAPFLAETLHRALVVPYDPGAPVSVHLAAYPAPGEERRSPALEEAMARALAITELARAARTQAGLKVRQPLLRILVAGDPGGPAPAGAPAGTPAAALEEALLEVIRDEINVKQVDFVPPAAILGARLKPIFKALGPRFGGDVNKAATAIKAVDSDAVRAGQPGGVWRVTVEGHGEVEILATEVEIEEFALDGFALAEDAGLRVALDTRLTPALEREGMVRELVHRLQSLRKEQGLEITDRVSVRLGVGGVLAEAVAEHRAYAQAELLAESFEIGPPGSPGDVWDVEGEAVTVRLERVKP